jgi:hypothetical protein
VKVTRWHSGVLHRSSGSVAIAPRSTRIAQKSYALG